MNTTNYPGFNHKAVDLSAFSFSIDTFVISLKNGRIIHFVPDDITAFKKWLEKHGIRDIDQNDGIPKAMKNKHGIW